MPFAPARSFICALSVFLVCAIASCIAAEPPASTSAQATPVAAPRVDPKAQAVVERGLAVVTQLKSLDVTVRFALEGPDAAEHSTGMETPARWLFHFGRDAKPSASRRPSWTGTTRGAWRPSWTGTSRSAWKPSWTGTARSAKHTQ